MFQYSVLKYYHSLALGEQVNLGILISSGKEGKIEFLYPRHLKRLSSIYSDLNVHFLRHYLTDFEKRADDLTKNPINKFLKEYSLNKVIYDYFLIPDSNALRFSQVRNVKETDYEKLKEYYYHAFLGEYEEEPSERKDENYIIKKVKKHIHKKYPEAEKKLKKNIQVSNTSWGVQLNFDIGWVNGSTNLITPLGFDLSDKNLIIEKATKWYGRLAFLRETAKNDNYYFDIIPTKPRKKEFFSAYDHAINILNESDAPKAIYPEDKLDDYLKNLASTIK